MENEQRIFSLILHSGDARNLSIKALEIARENNFEEALQLLDKAGKEINEAHQSQIDLIQEDMVSDQNLITLLVVHAQDHLMCSMVVRDLAREIIKMRHYDYLKLNNV